MSDTDEILKLIDDSTRPAARRGKWTARFLDENDEDGDVIVSCDDGKGGDIVMPLEVFKYFRKATLEDTMNQSRIEIIEHRPRFAAHIDPLGNAALVDGAEGRVDAVFVDLDAAIACGIIEPGWFAEQSGRDETTRDERWYSVVLPHGAVLIGERELQLKP